MIIFKKIRWCNFLSTGNVPIEIDLNSYNSTLITGINGTGKSTLLCALTFVLFGKSFRHINKPQLLNSITKRNLLVEVEFSIGEINYRIRRGMVPIIFEIYQNDIMLNVAADSRDYQQYLERIILKTNYKSFCQVVVLGSATYKSFMRLEAAQKREIIEDLLDLEIFTNMNLVLKQKIIVNADNRNEISLERVKLENKIKILQEHISHVNSINEKTIKDYEEKVDDLKEEIDTYKMKIDYLIEELKDEDAYTKQLNKYNSCEIKLKNKLEMILKEIKFFKSHEHCPTCEQKIDINFQNLALSSRKLKANDIENALKEINIKSIEIMKEISNIIYIKEKINELKLKQNYNKTEIKYLTNQIEIILKDINNANVSIFKEDIIKYKDLLEQRKLDYYSYEEEKSLYNILTMIFKDNGVKSHIIKQYIPVMNKFINKFLSDLEFFGTFELDENFKETIKSRYRDTFSYESFSQGERFRIDIALLFTWREISKYRNSIATNLLIMDEVFDGPLDNDGIDYMFKLFESLKGTNIFVITPKGDYIMDKFDRVIMFGKKKNFSEIVETQ